MSRKLVQNQDSWDFPGGSGAENPLSNAGDVGLINPGRGTQVPHAEEQLSLPTTTRESVL